MNMPYELFPGEGAFYGPSWSSCCATPGPRLAVRHLAGGHEPARAFRHQLCGQDDNSRKRPVMLHRALFGSLERFTGIPIEHYAGAFPTWLAPQQAVVMTITEAQCDYARDVVAQLRAAGVRVEADLRNEKIGYKIREHSLQNCRTRLSLATKRKQAVWLPCARGLARILAS